MATLKELREAVEAGTATPDLWDALAAEIETLVARPTMEALQQAQEVTDTTKDALADLQSSLTAKTDEIDQLSAAHAAAIAKLADTLATANNIPREMLTGKNLEELDTSLSNARTLVSKITEGIRQATAATIPTGAPGRTEPDFSSLPPREKIKAGIAARQNGH